MDPNFRPEAPTLAADYTILELRGWGLCSADAVNAGVASPRQGRRGPHPGRGQPPPDAVSSPRL